MAISLGITVQGRVIYALMMREIHTLYGNTIIGYLWAVFQCLANVLIFWFIRFMLGAHAPHGMSILAFLLSGFLPWLIFSDTLAKCMSAVRANRALLTFAQVTPLDLMISRAIVVWATQLVSSILIIILGYLVNQPVFITNFGYFLLAIMAAPIFGLSMGIIISTLGYFWSPLIKIVHIFMRIVFFTSGIFFSISVVPHPYQDYLLYNPLVHLIELARKSMSAPYMNSVLDLNYFIMWFLISFVFALLFERYMRGKIVE